MYKVILTRFFSVIGVVFIMYCAYRVALRVPAAEQPPQPPKFAAHGLTTQKRLDICRLLLLGWHKQEIANRVTCSLGAIYHVERNLVEFDNHAFSQSRGTMRPDANHVDGVIV